MRDQILKARLLTDLLFFARWMFKVREGTLFQALPFLVRIAETLEQVAAGEITRLIINIPPRYGKTVLVVHLFIAWCLANNPRARFIHLSYADDLVLDNSAAVREIVKSDDYQRLFGIQIRKDADSKKKWYTDQGGGMYATSSGGQVTGFGAGLRDRIRLGTGSPADGFGGAIIIDDPIKPEDAYSETIRGRINRRHNSTFRSRVNSKDTPIIVVMQRIHELDYTGFLLDGGSGEEWTHLCIPVRDEDGVPLWPDMHDAETLAAMEASDPYTFAGQYMQRPAPLGGGVFKDEWWRYHSVTPRLQWRAIYADTAQKTKEQNDWTVMQCWGKSWDGQAILVDQIRGKWEAPELLVQARAFWKKHKAAPREHGHLRAMKIEDKVSGTGLIQTLQREGVPVVPIQRNIDKYQRALDAAPSIQAGLVSLPQDAPWLSGFLGEHGAFPNGAHDDQIDPMMDAVLDIVGGGVRDYSKML